jgi:hypothetical protein
MRRATRCAISDANGRIKRGVSVLVSRGTDSVAVACRLCGAKMQRPRSQSKRRVVCEDCKRLHRTGVEKTLKDARKAKKSATAARSHVRP